LSTIIYIGTIEADAASSLGKVAEGNLDLNGNIYPNISIIINHLPY
jgi:hypothetical protein